MYFITNVLQERLKLFYMRGAANNFSVQFNMKYCSVSGCENKTGKSGLSFFSFSKDKRLKEEWVKFINRSDWAPKPNSKICSAHFSPHCITANNHLRSGSVPTQDPEHQAIQLEHDYAQSNNCKEGLMKKSSSELAKSNRKLVNKTCYLRKKVKNLETELEKFRNDMSAENFMYISEKASEILQHLLKVHCDKNESGKVVIKNFALSLHLEEVTRFSTYFTLYTLNYSRFRVVI